MLMGGDLTAQWRCEMHTAVWRTKTECGAAKWRCVFGIPAIGYGTEGNQITTQRLQVVRSETQGADITELVHGFTLHRAVITHTLHRAVVTHTPITKVRHSLRPFSRNSHIVTSIKCRYALPHFTQMSQKMWAFSNTVLTTSNLVTSIWKLQFKNPQYSIQSKSIRQKWQERINDLHRAPRSCRDAPGKHMSILQ
jgi:hypothetical protein